MIACIAEQGMNPLTGRKLHKHLRGAELVQQKEKTFVDRPWQGYCDNEDHPRFTIKVDYNKKWAACYYCSKIWILDDGS